MLAVFFLPGLVLAFVGRMRGLAAFAVAPALSLALGGIGAILLGFVGIRWSVWSYIGITAVAVLMGVLLTHFFRARNRAPIGEIAERETVSKAERSRAVRRMRRFAPLVGVVIAAVVSFAPLRDGMRRPDYPALTWDSVYHHSAIRYILDTGNGSSLTLGAVATNNDAPAYYPGAWHDLVSLTVGSLPISVSLNVAALVLSCIIWPLSMAYLARVAFPKHTWLPLLAPIIASGFVAFPARMISYGTVWPAAMGTALVPMLIGLTLTVTSRSTDAAARRRLALILAAALVGAALCHPTAPIAAVFLSAPFLIHRYTTSVIALIERGKRIRAGLGAALPLLGIVLVCAAIAIVPQLRSVFFFETTPVGPATDAIGSAIFDTMLMPLVHGNEEPFWVAGLLASTGVVMTLMLREHRWVSVSWTISIVLYVAAAGEQTVLRPLVGFWYSDPVRLGGLVPIFTSLLASYAVLRTVEAMVLFAARSNVTLREPVAALVASLVILVGIAALLYPQTKDFRTEERTSRLAADYWEHLQWEDGLASLPELRFIERLGEELPEDAVVLGDPTSGAALLYSLAGVDTVFRTLSGSWDADARYLGRNFNRIDRNPRICRLLAEYGVTHFYDDTRRYLPDIVHRRDMVGLTIIGVDREDLRLVDTSGDGARIYEIEACDS
ncbi:hypothetical protein AC792_05510 [Arthrobacter sp. RIT-PI-e]|nr:hypothetical protein AC792_05510 [Arthrobacter sp. RIT-PI-e]